MNNQFYETRIFLYLLFEYSYQVKVLNINNYIGIFWHIFHFNSKLLPGKYIQKVNKQKNFCLYELNEIQYLVWDIKPPNHQTTNFVFPIFFHEFFSVWAVEKENKHFIGFKDLLLKRYNTSDPNVPSWAIVIIQT